MVRFGWLDLKLGLFSFGLFSRHWIRLDQEASQETRVEDEVHVALSFEVGLLEVGLLFVGVSILLLEVLDVIEGDLGEHHAPVALPVSVGIAEDGIILVVDFSGLVVEGLRVRVRQDLVGGSQGLKLLGRCLAVFRRGTVRMDPQGHLLCTERERSYNKEFKDEPKHAVIIGVPSLPRDSSFRAHKALPSLVHSKEP